MNKQEIKELNYMLESIDKMMVAIQKIEEQLNELKTECEKDDKIETVQLSRFVDGEIKVEMIIDNGPKFDSAGFSTEDR